VVDAAQALDAVIDSTAAPIDGVACDPSAEYNRSYVASSPAACAVLLYVCPPNTTAFQNECGCGCEQSSSCPEYVDCMPGVGPENPLCDPSNDQCPYSDRAL
jgi:hypothetical protein